MKKTYFLLVNCILIGMWVFLLIAAPKSVWAKDKPVELKMSVAMSTKSSKYKKGFEPWAKKVEEATKGKVKVVIYPSGSLAAARQNYDACIDGIVDIGWIALTLYPGRFPLTEILDAPGLGMKDPIMDSEITWRLFNKFPEMQKEFSDVKVLFMHAFSPLVIATTKKPIRHIGDVKGMKIRATKGCSGLLRAAGAAPVFIPPSEIFLSMQKGVIEGNAIGWEGQKSFGAIKLAKYFTIVPALPGNHFVMYMNKKKWNNLTPDLQKAVWRVSDGFAARFYGEGDDEASKEVMNQIKKMNGKEIIELSTEENEKWIELSKLLQEKLISTIEGKGLPGRAAFNELTTMAKEYEK
ncbi:TRAP transporter substrate-binding protein [bacterium]|nr:TRAP transporter substrate-binding protein [bacterium]